MPRICDGYSDPHDFCQKCWKSHFSTEEDAQEEYGEGDGPDDRGNCFAYDAEHPDYADEDYTCEKCGCELTAKDNDT